MGWLFSKKDAKKKNTINDEDSTLLRKVIEDMDLPIRLVSSENVVIYANRSMQTQFGDFIGAPCHLVLMRGEPCEYCITKRCLETGKSETKDIQVDDEYFKVISSPVILESGELYAIEMFRDITESKKMEMELFFHYQKLRAEITFARQIQTSVLPKNGNYWDAFRINSMYLPADDLGGDLYDIIQVTPNQILMYIADVSGHGVQASLLTIYLREVVRGRLKEASEGLLPLMRALMDGYKELTIQDEQYLSLLLCSYNISTKELTIMNAGHNCFPLIVRQDGQVEEIPVKGLPICKLEIQFEHEEVVVPLEKGERLILYTDGIIEEYSKMAQRAFGTEGVKEILRNNPWMDGKLLSGRIIEGALRFSGVVPRDDRAIMIADVL